MKDKSTDTEDRGAGWTRPLENRKYYTVEIPNAESPGGVERAVLLHAFGLWIGRPAGPLTVAQGATAGFVVVGEAPEGYGDPLDAGAKAPPLEDEAWYVIELPPEDHPRAEPVRMVMLHAKGYWLDNNDDAYEEGPLTVEEAEYKVIRKVDLWPLESAAA